jgi:hypothetical protein
MSIENSGRARGEIRFETGKFLLLLFCALTGFQHGFGLEKRQ